MMNEDAVEILYWRPIEGLLPGTLEPCHAGNETPVRPFDASVFD